MLKPVRDYKKASTGPPPPGEGKMLVTTAVVQKVADGQASYELSWTTKGWL